MHSCELVVTISATACAISKGKSPDEIALLATIFSQLGDTLATIAAQEALCAPNNRAAVTPPDTPANVTSDSSVDPSADSIANAVFLQLFLSIFINLLFSCHNFDTFTCYIMYIQSDRAFLHILFSPSWTSCGWSYFFVLFTLSCWCYAILFFVLFTISFM